MAPEYLLIKFAEAQYIDDMYENEYLYFNRFIGFRGSSKDEKGRLDPKEGNLKNTQIAYLKLKAVVDGKEFVFGPGDGFNGQLCEHYSDPKLISCSLYGITINNPQMDIEIDEKALGLGEKALIINARPFWNLLDDVMEKDNKWYARKFVTYYDPKTYDGDLSFHHKDSFYSYQQEYRILKQVEDDSPIGIKIPGLKRVSMIKSYDDLKPLKVQIINSSL